MLWLKIEKELMRQKISVYRLAKNTGISATTLQNWQIARNNLNEFSDAD